MYAITIKTDSPDIPSMTKEGFKTDDSIPKRIIMKEQGICPHSSLPETRKSIGRITVLSIADSNVNKVF